MEATLGGDIIVRAKSRKRVKAGKKAARKRSAGTRKAARARWRKR